MLEQFFTRGKQLSRASQLEEDCETLLKEEKDAEGSRQHKYSRKYIPNMCLVLLWILSLAIAVVVGVWIGSGYLADADRLCTKHISQYCTDRASRMRIAGAD